MQRFYMPSFPARGEEFPLSPENARKASRVLRLIPGDEIILWNEAGSEYRALITKVTGQFVYVRVLEEVENDAESPLSLRLVQGIPKGDKLELIIQKATELGVQKIYPVVTERTVVRIPEERRASRLKRWQAIAREAARQCGRVRIPEVAEIDTLEGIWRHVEGDAIKLICWEEGVAGLKAYLRSFSAPPQVPVYLFVGPEGGFSAREVEACVARGGVVVSLGPRILRTETAGLIGLSLLLYEWGDLGGP
ncbi:MAG: 16S rRNA (uracil(1498)-N(3))-methyltransferase [Thermacetogeniaceae bacterium]